MQKWQIYSAIGKGRPASATKGPHYLVRCLHTTSPRFQEAGQDTVKHENRPPPPSRASRLRAASSEVQNLFNSSAASKDAPQPVNSGFKVRYESGDGKNAVPRFPERATAPADMKERLRQRAMERARQSQGDDKIRSAAPSPRSFPPRQSDRPPRPSPHQRSRRENDRPPRNTVDPVPGARIGGSRKAAFDANDDDDDDYDDNDDVPDRDGNIERSRQATEEYQEAIVKAAFESADNMKESLDGEDSRVMFAFARMPDVEPKVESREAMMMTGPGIVSGEDGAREMLAEKLTLARKVLNGGFHQWKSREERDDVMILVQRLKHANPEELVKGKRDRPVRGKEEVERLTGELLGKMVQGEYHMARSKDGDIIRQVEMAVNANKSYFPADERRIVEEVRKLLGTGDVQGMPKQKVNG